MTIEEMKSRIKEIDRILDYESTTDEVYNSLEEEARHLTYEIGISEKMQESDSVKDINPNDWLSSFLASFGIMSVTKTITSKQYDVFRRVNNGRPFKCNGLRYDFVKNRDEYGSLVIKKI